jgi:hypothetical protein
MNLKVRKEARELIIRSKEIFDTLELGNLPEELTLNSSLALQRELPCSRLVGVRFEDNLSKAKCKELFTLKYLEACITSCSGQEDKVRKKVQKAVLKAPRLSWIVLKIEYLHRILLSQENTSEREQT